MRAAVRAALRALRAEWGGSSQSPACAEVDALYATPLDERVIAA